MGGEGGNQYSFEGEELSWRFLFHSSIAGKEVHVGENGTTQVEDVEDLGHAGHNRECIWAMMREEYPGSFFERCKKFRRCVFLSHSEKVDF